MRIAVHAKILSEDKLNGMGYYTYNLLKYLSKIDKKNEYILFSSDPLSHRIEAANFKEKIIRFPKFWTYTRFAFELIKEKYDVVFVPSEKLPFFARGKKVITVYDLQSLKGYMKSPISIGAKIHFLVAILSTIRKADRILTISEATKKSILNETGVSTDKITVTQLGYDRTIFYPRTDGVINEIKKKYGIDKSYFINTSSLIWYRKNIPRVIKAFSLLRRRVDCKLIITGKKGEDYKNTVRAIAEAGLEEDIIFLGYVPIEDMPALLSGAVALIFPSLHEGFGLPIVEAMACGCPVITSNVSAMPEVAGDAGVLVDPYKEDEIALAMEKIYSDLRFRDEFIARGLKRSRMFSWEEAGQKTLHIFEAMC